LYRAALPGDSIEVARSHKVLARTLRWTYDHTESIRLYKRSLAIETQILGADHVDTLQTLAFLGATQVMAGHFSEAEATLDEAMRHLQAHGEHLNMIAYVRKTQGALWLHQGHYDRAKALYERSLREYQQADNGDKPIAVYVRHYIALIARMRGELDLAERHYRTSVTRVTERLADDHPFSGWVMADLAELLIARGARSEAAELLDRAVGCIDRARAAYARGLRAVLRLQEDGESPSQLAELRAAHREMERTFGAANVYTHILAGYLDKAVARSREHSSESR
ncbi:MAG: tetratricopeptide repeat protein, partial [Myxococcota bacterium]